MWRQYMVSLRRAIKRAGEAAKDPMWYWSPWGAYQAGYRAGLKAARKRR